MPKKLHDALARAARKRGLTGKAFDAYVYGPMSKPRKKAKRYGKK